MGLTTSNIRRTTENQRHHHRHQTATQPAARRSESLNRIVTVSSVVQSVLSRPTLLMDAVRRLIRGDWKPGSHGLEPWLPASGAILPRARSLHDRTGPNTRDQDTS